MGTSRICGYFIFIHVYIHVYMCGGVIGTYVTTVLDIIITLPPYFLDGVFQRDLLASKLQGCSCAWLLCWDCRSTLQCLALT